MFLEKLGQIKKARENWLANYLNPEIIAFCNKQGIFLPPLTNPKDSDNNWGNIKWHIRNRLRQSDDLIEMFPQYLNKADLLADYLKNYDLSILPLNLTQKEGVKKFLPELGFTPIIDPYGVQRECSVITREFSGKKYYLSTYKKNYGTLLPIVSNGSTRIICPIGCRACYRGHQTRFKNPLLLIHGDGSSEAVSIPAPDIQFNWLVEEWNTNFVLAGVYDILISGGEPLMLPNQTWEKILKELGTAKHLKCFRICTGALFLGLPFRFDEEFIGLLTNFRGKTGVQIKIAAHVSHPENITPEVVYFAKKISTQGIEILPQIPLEPEINFWSNDLERTAATLTRLDRLLSLTAGRPYKWIIDLQRGISLLSAIEIWRRLHDRHQTEADVTRPTSLAILLPIPEGNLNLSYHSLWAIKMEVDKRNNLVHYRIPHPAGVWVDYNEPLQKGVNDTPQRLKSLMI